MKNNNLDQQPYLEKFYKKGTAMTSSPAIVIEKNTLVIHNKHDFNTIFKVEPIIEKNIIFLWLITLGHMYYLFTYLHG